MIYTVISSLKENRIEINKRDCRFIRQPLSLLSEKTKEYIESGKNESHRAERRLAYLTLISSLKAFYNIDNPEITVSEQGKPYIKDKAVYFNLSHSNGMAVVCLSDEGEVGVDLQSEIDSERAERLKERFFASLEVKNESVGAEYYYCELLGEDAEIYRITLPDFQPCEADFSARWVSAESIMKLTGRGFADADRVSDLKKDTKTEIKALDFDGKYYLAISVSRRISI